MRLGTTVAAAHELAISQPAVSNAITQLERNLNLRLFTRTKGRLQPTEEAELLYEKSLPVFESFHVAQATASRIKEKVTGHLRIASTPSIGSSVIPLAIKSLRKNRPDLKISSIVSGLEEVQERVANGDVSIGFYYTTVNHPLVISDLIAYFDMVCAIPPGHSLADRKEIHAEELAREPLISYEPKEKLAAILESVFSANGCEHRPIIDVRFVHSACELVAQGQGLAVVDAMMTLRREYQGRVIFADFAPRTTLPVYVCSHRDHVTSYSSQLFIKHFKKVFREEIMFRVRLREAG